MASLTSTVDLDSLNVILEGTGRVLLDFWAPWCGPCRMLSVILDEAKDELPDELTIVKVNVDEAKEIAAEYDIQSLPTMILLRGQEKLSSKAGFISKSALVQWICETVNS